MAHLLIVEDEAHIAKGLQFNLELDGHRVEIARDGLEAKRWLVDEKRPVDLVILDVMLPHLSGLELCRLLRRQANYTPVLMLTAKREDADKVHGLRAGADDYLAKPFNLEELLARVEALLRRRDWGQEGASEPDLMAFGEVCLNFDTFEATVAGHEVKLTPIEFGIMQAFKESEGKVLSREAILSRVWGWEGPATTRTVDNFILRLRKALEPEPSRPRHILSVRGAGYRFVP